MDNDGEAGVNEGAGWCEVKKKHRISSKSSAESSGGVFSNKTSSSSVSIQISTNGKVGNLQNRQRPVPSTQERIFATLVKVGGENSCPALKEADQAVLCLEKRVINEGTEVPKSPCRSINIAETTCGTVTFQDVPKIEKLDKIPKIKWGDLEDDTLALYGCGNSDKTSEVGCHDIVNDNLSAFGNSGDVSLEDKKVLPYDDAEQFPDGMLSSAVKEEMLEGNWKEVNEISSEDSNFLENMVSPNESVGNLGEIHHESVEPTCTEVGNRSDSNNLATENCLSLSAEEIRMVTEPLGLNNISEGGVLDDFEVPVIGGAPDDALATAVAGEGQVLQDGLLNVDLSKSQLISALGEGESGESKERFRQRLWCFLFENLNRAVDELYLLCELECDVEQMKEAILVLEEAGFDFRELKSRVEGFENTKKSSIQPSKDGSQVTMKTDHRRPHALSWEVRRMTTSPHRAEILSSSLEAFKKIQQERASKLAPHSAKDPGSTSSTHHHVPFDRKSPGRTDGNTKSRKQTEFSDIGQDNPNGERRNVEPNRLSKAYMLQDSRMPSQSLSTSDNIASQVSLKDVSAGKLKKEPLGSVSEIEKQVPKKDKVLTEKHLKSVDPFKRSISNVEKEKEKEKEKRNAASWKSMDAWREKRNWVDILASPLRSSSRVSHSPGMSRKSVERARVLHDKLMYPEKKKKSSLDMKREAEEKHARAMRIRNELENERVQRLQRTSEKLNRVNEWQAGRSLKLREGMYARHQRSESRHEAYLAQVAKRAGDESSKVNEVRFITSMNEENKKLILRQKLHDSELRRAEKLLVIKSKQKEDMAREEAVLERRKLIEAEKLQRLAEIQRKKEEAQVRREEERKASSAAREAKAVEQLRRKEVRAKAQQEEAELLAQKLAERLSESEQRRKFYLEQIREKASMDFREQSSPLLRRSSIKEVQGRSVSANGVDDDQAHCVPGVGSSALGIGNAASQHLLKRRIKKIRQRLMALKYEFTEPPVGAESAGIGYRALVGTARVKIGKWLQELQKLRQARKEGAASIGLIVGDMIKFLEGKDSELHASRQAGLIDFIAAALPASHTSRPEACQVTIYLLRLLRVVLSVPSNRSYFLAQNLLPPIIPMLSAALENYIKIAASFNIPGNSNVLSSKTSVENMESIAEVLEGFLWTVTTIVGHMCSDERQLQMQDGLMELVISYQVMHRLRDLFALYDRPQVEGSPFPSSIMLSLNLLAVLTSRPRTISSVDWGAYLSRTAPDYKTLESKLVETAESINLKDSSAKNATIGDCRSQLSLQNVSAGVLLDEKSSSYGVTLSGVPEDRPLVEPCRTSRHELLSNDWNPGKVHTGISVKVGDVGAAGQLCAASFPGESHKNQIEEPNQSSLFQKDDKNLVDISVVQNSRLQQDGRVIQTNNENGQGFSMKQPVAFLLSVIAESGLVSLPSLLTAVLLQANSRLSSDQASYVLPSNFEEVATGVLKVLNNLALLDISHLQNMLARPDLKMEFFHFMSFLLSHCTSKWKAATDQVGLLLLESILLLGYFALFHPENQAVLRWGKSPTILHKVCDLPFVFFSDPELTPILAGTLVAVCYGCEQNRGVVQQELSMEMLLSLLKSCRYAIQSDSSPPENAVTDYRCDGNQTAMDLRKLQCDFSIKSGRGNSRNTRVSLGKAGMSGTRVISKARNQKDGKGTTRTCDEWALKHNPPALEASSTFMLHSRFPSGFIDRAEEFFSAATPSL